MAELEIYKSIPRGSAMVHQITSPRTVRAIVVIALLALVIYQTIIGHEVPPIVSTSLALALGSYFEIREKEDTTEQKAVVKALSVNGASQKP